MTSRQRPLILVAQAADGALSAAFSGVFDVEVVREGSDVVRIARERRPDAVLLAAAGPEENVPRALRQLALPTRADPLPVVVVADRPDPAEAARCLEAGAADYVPAGTAREELVARVAKAIRDADIRRELAELARTDALTGLANFRALMGRIAEEFSRASRYGYPLSLVMIDLDNLKQINDRFGHDVGNRALLALTRTLRAGLRQTDFAARYGGDEFVVLLPHQTPAEARVMLERLRRALAGVGLEGPDGRLTGMTLTLSAGIAGHTPEDPRHSSESLLQLADAALYQAKRGGRNRVVVCEERSPAAGAARPI